MLFVFSWAKGQTHRGAKLLSVIFCISGISSEITDLKIKLDLGNAPSLPYLVVELWVPAVAVWRCEESCET